jgi:hypothetical protein
VIDPTEWLDFHFLPLCNDLLIGFEKRNRDLINFSIIFFLIGQKRMVREKLHSKANLKTKKYSLNYENVSSAKTKASSPAKLLLFCARLKFFFNIDTRNVTILCFSRREATYSRQKSFLPKNDVMLRQEMKF